MIYIIVIGFLFLKKNGVGWGGGGGLDGKLNKFCWEI